MMDGKTQTTSRKRKNEDEAISAEMSTATNTTLNTASCVAKTKPVGKETKQLLLKTSASMRSKERCKRSQNTEDYVNFVGDIIYPKKIYGPYGFHADKLRFPIERITTLGYLLSPLRRPSIIEKWCPFDISVFEACITLYGKNFSRIQKHIQTKTVQDIIEFYYDWKKTSHYKQWKKTYIPDERDIPTVIGD